MSQEKLAKGLGLTFQQVQKYEKGVNRIGASRMVEIAKVLNVPVHVLFGSENYGEEPADVGILALAAADTVGATKMLQHYNSISTDTLRALAIRILAALAQCEGTRPPTGDEA